LQKQNNKQNDNNHKRIEGAFDISNVPVNRVEELSTWHESLCGCNQATTCIIMYNRCFIRSQIYHSLNYPKRQSTISYFVRYTNDDSDLLFGSIKHFFTYKCSSFALISNHRSLKPFSDIFASSSYHTLLSQCINSYFYILESNASSHHYVPVQKILNLCVIFEEYDFIIATLIAEAYEHD
jgi:hypothetical protein